MAENSFSGNVEEMIKMARSYLNSRIELWKLTLLEKVSLAGAYFLGSLIIVLIIGFCLLFVSLAFAYWYGQTTGDLAMGFLITAGIYVVLGIIIYFGRKNLISGPIIRALAAIIYKDDDPEDPEEL
jgi:hypothetical protein